MESFQRVNVFPRETVFSNVQIALIARERLYTNPFRNASELFRDEVAELLSLVQLTADESVKAGHLAHGKQKQLELALALATRPKMLLLDEPTAGMSASEARLSMNLINDIVRQRGLTLLFTEHDMEFVFGIANRITVLHVGKVVVTGSPAEVRESEHVKQIYLGKS